MTSGHYLIVEGVDYTGKTTLAKRLTTHLNNVGINTLYTRHPGSTKLGQELRKMTREEDLDPATEALLFAADNSAYTNQILIPSLEKGIWVIADRNNFVSSLAYQKASGCDLKALDRIHSTIENAPKADALFILTADRECLLDRAEKRVEEGGRDRFGELMSREDYFFKVAQAYREMIEKERNVTLRLNKFIRSRQDTPKYMEPNVVEISTNDGEEKAFEAILEHMLDHHRLTKFFKKEKVAK